MAENFQSAQTYMIEEVQDLGENDGALLGTDLVAIETASLWGRELSKLPKLVTT